MSVTKPDIHESVARMLDEFEDDEARRETVHSYVEKIITDRVKRGEFIALIISEDDAAVMEWLQIEITDWIWEDGIAHAARD